MVTVVCSPSECQFGQVAGSDYDAVGLVGDVHKDLGPFSGLRVLVGRIVVACIMRNILEMLLHGRDY